MLFLQIQSYQKSSNEHPVSMQIEQGTLSLGRDPSNSWSLPDPGRVLSKQHCLIESVQDGYKLTDTSTNGVFVNASSEPLGRNNAVQLASGDTIRLSDYELSVLIEVKQQEPIGQPVPAPVDVAPPPPPPVSALAEGEDWKAMLEPQAKPAPTIPDQAQAVDVPDLAQSHYDAPSVGLSIPENWGDDAELASPSIANEEPVKTDSPAVPEPVKPVVENVPTPSIIPEDFAAHGTLPAPSSSPEQRVAPSVVPVTDTHTSLTDAQAPLTGTQTPSPAVQPPPIARQSAMGSDLVQAFLKGAGLDPNTLLTDSPEQMMEEIGGLFRKVTMGLMGVLSARGDIKSEFRLSQTMIKPVENNPLKFSLNIDEAMVALINKKGQGYMSAEAAFDEAFDDLKAHQIAVLTGMQSALKSILERLDPAIIQSQDAEVKGVKKLLGGQKSQYWDDYVLLYKTLFQKTEDDFQTVFGHEFARAYEQQIRKQKSSD